MANQYQIKSTAGDKTITVQPLQINGSVVSIADSDVNLIGQGTTQWGSDFNESLYHVVENFACPEKPGSPGVPQDEGDLGTGLGINNPVQGQMWYNTTTGQILVYTISGSPASATFQTVNGIFVGTVAPSSPFEGDLWYDTSVPQLKIYNGSAFVSTAERYLLLDGTAPMTGDLDVGGQAVTNVANIVGGSPLINGQHATNKNYVDQEIDTIITGGAVDHLYVNVTGDTMSGNLTMDGNVVDFTSMSLNAGNGNINIAPDVQLNENGLIAAGNSFYVNIDSDNTGLGSPAISANFVVSRGANVVDGSQVALFEVEDNGRVKASTASYETLVDSDDVIPNKKYVDDTAAGSSPTGTVTMFAGAAAPSSDYLLCDGTSVSTATYAALFAVIGYTYGGSGGSFNLPNFNGRMPVGVGASDPVPSYGNKTISLADRAGQWFSRLTSINQMPAHNHGGGSHYHNMFHDSNTVWRSLRNGFGNYTVAAGGTGNGGPDDIYQMGASTSTNPSTATLGRSGYNSSGLTTQGTGSNINTYPPYLGINFIIKT